jgi:hypothetical protein
MANLRRWFDEHPGANDGTADIVIPPADLTDIAARWDQMKAQRSALLRRCDELDASRPRIMDGYLPASISVAEVRALLGEQPTEEDRDA